MRTLVGAAEPPERPSSVWPHPTVTPWSVVAPWPTISSSATLAFTPISDVLPTTTSVGAAWLSVNWHARMETNQ